jgi:hypothetical protein
MKVHSKVSALKVHAVGDGPINPATTRGSFVHRSKAGKPWSVLADFSCVGILAFAGAVTISWIIFLVWGLGKMTRFW